MSTSTDQHKLFSNQTTKQAVLNQALQHPVTLGLMAIGILASAASLVFQLGSLGVILGASGIGLAVASFLYQFVLRRDVLAARHLEKTRALIESRRLSAMAAIRQDLTSLLSIVDARKYTEQAISQYDMAQLKFDNLKVLLGRKFEPHELAFSRYVGTAEQVYLSILDQLQQIIDALGSIATIDPVYVIKRLAALRDIKEKDEADQKEQETLEQRQSLRDSQLKRINELLTDNEEAMTVLAKTCAAIANINTGDRMAKSGIDDAMADLVDLAGRARAFHKSD